MATGYFSHSDCLAHDMGPGHPECPQRITAIEDQLRAQGLDVLMVRPDVPLARNEDLALAHPYTGTRLHLEMQEAPCDYRHGNRFEGGAPSSIT